MGKFDNYINVTAPLHSATTKGKLANANEIFIENDEDNVQNIINKTNEHIKRLDNRSSQMEESIKNISVTGGASVAEAVTYDNTTSGLEAVNVKGAIDELAAKNQEQDATIGTKAEKSEVAIELDKKFNKENIAQEFGDSKDKVVSQFALPFREIESPEFIKVIVDVNGHLLFTINLDGEVDWGKGVPAPIRVKLQEIINQCQQDKTDLLESINTLKDILDKTTIKDEEGTVVETPFRYIQNEEFIFAKVDANDKLLFGIQWDGTPKFGKTSVVEDRLQEQVNLLADKITAILGDDDTTSAIDTLKELKDFFASIDNTQTLTSILANLNSVSTKLGEDIKNLQDTKVDKEAGKSLIEDEVKECFRVIENEEFLWAVVDSEDRVLFGFYRATGRPYYPLNEMYHVIQNEEYFAAWLDADDKVVLGIRRDGQIIGEIHVVNALKQVISQLQSDLVSLQEKVGTIDTNLKELLDIFSLQENPEYLAVEKDADGKVLSATYNDGSHYFHNLKSETIDGKVDKKEGKSLINEDVADAHSTLEDPENRMEIVTDADGKVMSYRDAYGKKHEHDMQVTNLDVSNLNLQDNSVNDIGDALKANDFRLDSPSDFSNDSYIELPIPRIAAQVKLYAPKLPTTKQDDIKAEIEYNDKDGNYFRKQVILNAQGSSSMYFYVKNLAIDIADESKIKFGDFPAQDSFHIKKYYIDAFRGQCIVGYWFTEQVYKSRPVGNQYPYEYNLQGVTTKNSLGDFQKDFFTGAKCHPDGFPIVITWVNSNTSEETLMGVYSWNLKKSKEVYNMNKKKPENIILDGVINSSTIFNGSINWSSFEIRNPKSLLDINGNKYDGDNPLELSDTDTHSKKVKDYIKRLSSAVSDITTNKNKVTFEKYFIVNPFIDYWLASQVLYNVDGFSKNWIWCTWDGLHFTPTLYDLDSIFGQVANGTFIYPNSAKNIVGEGSAVVDLLLELYSDEIQKRYLYLRNKNIISVDNIINLLHLWLSRVGYDNLKNDLNIYTQTPSYRNGFLNENWEVEDYNWESPSRPDNYSNDKEYNQGDVCDYKGYRFKAKNTITGIAPVSNVYDKNPTVLGFYNSIKRVTKWLEVKIASLDQLYKYNI